MATPDEIKRFFGKRGFDVDVELTNTQTITVKLHGRQIDTQEIENVFANIREGRRIIVSMDDNNVNTLRNKVNELETKMLTDKTTYKVKSKLVATKDRVKKLIGK